MPHKLKWTMFPILLFILFSTLVYASEPMKPLGKILGGSLDSPVRIEVFSNFTCSMCREFYLQTIKKILQNYSSEDKVCVIYHDYPFKSHKYDWEAARYMEAASRISRETMLSVMEALYRDQASWSYDGKLKESISKVLSKEVFDELTRLSKDPEIDTLIDAQYDLAMEHGLTSTPTSFITVKDKHRKVETHIVYFNLKGFIDKNLE